MTPANTDGLLCPKCQHILHYHLRTYANLGITSVRTAALLAPINLYRDQADRTDPNQFDFRIGRSRIPNLGLVVYIIFTMRWLRMP